VALGIDAAAADRALVHAGSDVLQWVSYTVIPAVASDMHSPQKQMTLRIKNVSAVAVGYGGTARVCYQAVKQK